MEERSDFRLFALTLVWVAPATISVAREWLFVAEEVLLQWERGENNVRWKSFTRWGPAWSWTKIGFGKLRSCPTTGIELFADPRPSGLLTEKSLAGLGSLEGVQHSSCQTQALACGGFWGLRSLRPEAGTSPTRSSSCNGPHPTVQQDSPVLWAPGSYFTPHK